MHKKLTTWILIAAVAGVLALLATVMAAHFFPAQNETAALLNQLGVFATGFIVRPFGALVFGRGTDL